MEYILNEHQPLPLSAKKITYRIDPKGCHVCTSHKPVRTEGTVSIRRGTQMPLTHYVWKLHHGHAPSEHTGFILHACGNTRCLNPEHLYAGDYADLVREKRVRGRQPRYSKLTDQDVLAIKRNVTETARELADRHGVSLATIQNIWNEQVFRYLTVENYSGYQKQRRQRVLDSRRRQLQLAKRRDK